MAFGAALQNALSEQGLTVLSVPVVTLCVYVVVAAVIGAYAAMMDAGSGNSGDATAAAVIGAVGAGTAATVGPFIQEQIAAVGVAAYLRSDERA